LRRSRTGVELVDGGFASDVEVAAEVGASTAVPLLRDGAYVDVARCAV
jgi:2-phosphosulfolactate phosphatase